jgi:hypothetical protein
VAVGGIGVSVGAGGTAVDTPYSVAAEYGTNAALGTFVAVGVGAGGCGCPITANKPNVETYVVKVSSERLILVVSAVHPREESYLWTLNRAGLPWAAATSASEYWIVTFMGLLKLAESTATPSASTCDKSKTTDPNDRFSDSNCSDAGPGTSLLDLAPKTTKSTVVGAPGTLIDTNPSAVDTIFAPVWALALLCHEPK